MVLMMLDATKATVQRPLLEKELHNVGIRLNKQPPNIYFKLKKGGGLSFNATCKLTILSEALCRTILHEYSTCAHSLSHSLIRNMTEIFNAEVLVKEDASVGALAIFRNFCVSAP